MCFLRGNREFGSRKTGISVASVDSCKNPGIVNPPFFSQELLPRRAGLIMEETLRRDPLACNNLRRSFLRENWFALGTWDLKGG